MFWKKKPVTGEPSKAKAKELSPKDILANQIEQLGTEQTVSYQLAEVFGGELAIVELNPRSPKKGHKYILSFQKLVDGEPAGERVHYAEFNKVKVLAGWIIDRKRAEG